MIIISEPSAKATRRVNTGRSTSVFSCSSAGDSDTPDTRTHSESEFTHEVLAGDDDPPLTRRRGQPGAREGGGSGSSPPPTGCAKSVPDTAVTNGVQREATGTPTVTPRRRLRHIIAGQTPFVLRGGSRIRTLVGVRRRIYRPLYTSVNDLPQILGKQRFLGNPPYARHPALSQATKLWAQNAARRLRHSVSGLAGLHAYFFLATARLGRSGDVGCFVTSAGWLRHAACRSVPARRCGCGSQPQRITTDTVHASERRANFAMRRFCPTVLFKPSARLHAP